MNFANFLFWLFCFSSIHYYFLPPQVIASDWEEESEISDQIKHNKTNTKINSLIEKETAAKESTAEITTNSTKKVLQGNATAVRTLPEKPYTLSALAAQNAAKYKALALIDGQATTFLRSAQTNIITPPTIFKDWLKQSQSLLNKDWQKNLESLNPESVIVIRGQWDDSSKPLHSFGIRFKAYKTKELNELDLSKCKVLIVDCAGAVPKNCLQKIRNFVIEGGYLLSTDWALQNLIEKAFPQTICWNRDNSDGSITDAYILTPSNKLFQGINIDSRRSIWKLDKMSQCIKILNPNKVTILVRSSLLAARDPQLRALEDPFLAGALAVEFQLGRGKVLHLAGHFDNCSTSMKPYMLPDPSPEIGISLRQALSANFIMEGLLNPKGSADNGNNLLGL